MESDLELEDELNIGLKYLSEWGLSEPTIRTFEENQITFNLLCEIEETELKELIPSLKERIIFKRGRKKLEKIIHDTASEETLSVSDLSAPSPVSSLGSASASDCELPSLTTTTAHQGTNANKDDDLNIILKSNTRSAGELCLASLKKNDKLDTAARNYLVKSIVEYYMKQHGVMKKDQFEYICAQIVSLVPTEVKETYYIPSQKFGTNKYIPARGKLVDKYNNYKRSLRANGVIDAVRRRTSSVPPKTSLQNETAAVEGESVSCEEFEDIKVWLKYNKEPLVEVLDNWKKTSSRRLKELQQSERYLNINDVINDWPSYKLSIGYKLIELDFEYKFKGSEISLYTKWPEFIDKAHKHIKNIKAAAEYIQIIEENPSEDIRDFCYCAAIGYKIVPTVRIQCQDTNGRKKTIKPSIKESMNSFILHAKIQSEVPTKLEHRRQSQLSKGLRCQPIIVVVGTTIGTLKDFYVSYDNILYKLDSFLKAVDVCFKTFHTLDAEYPTEAIHIWTFIQKYFYQIDLKTDKKLSGVSSFISDLK